MGRAKPWRGTPANLASARLQHRDGEDKDHSKMGLKKKKTKKQNRATPGAGEMVQQLALVENWWGWFLVPT